MRESHPRILQIVLALLLILAAGQSSARAIHDSVGVPSHPVLQRPDQASAAPYTAFRIHKAGNLKLTVTNWGVLGNPDISLIDPETGQPAPLAGFPAGRLTPHLHVAALWAGALVAKEFRHDTLVTTGNDGFFSTDAWLTELYPDTYANGGDFIERSNDPNNSHYDPKAVSAQDFLCTYTDTLTDPAYVCLDPVTLEMHKPLSIHVQQSSYVWPFEYSGDFVVVQYWITNTRGLPLHEVRVGVLIAPWVGRTNQDDMVGFLRSVPAIIGYGIEDTVMIAWWADADGDTRKKSWHTGSVRSVMAIRFLGVGRSPCDETANSLEYSFNWWAPHDIAGYDWGPQRLPGDRSITGGRGHPHGDTHKYRFMANGEIDYDQYLANENIPGWIPPPGIKSAFAGTYNVGDGHNVLLLLSVGPFELEPGDSIPIGIVIAGGEFFHRNPRNIDNIKEQPEVYYSNLDFADLSQNLQWAAMIYDNPGIDTDDDGCTGPVYVSNCRDTCVPINKWQCQPTEVCDSVYYAGDGIPDLKGPPPPPSPLISVTTEPEKIHIEWNGREPELFVDPFLQRRDFEGYNVYLGLGHNPNTLDLMASWDLVNFDRYRYDAKAWPSHWVSRDPPFTVDELCRIYGDDFIPQQYPDRLSYFEDDDGNRFFFKPHGGNLGNEYAEHGVIMTNPIQYVRTDSSLNEGKQLWEYFGHYECTVENLLPSQPYYVAVTAFDGGLIGSGLEPLESSRQANLQLVYPSYSPDYVAAKRMKVSVYPNPYKIDARYRERRFEDPNREGFKERTRRIHFVNLPPKATIKIYSLDGDLIREIHHPESRFSDTPSHTAWDLISRNTQAVTSGIYLYSVESDWGTQVGKIVIIK